MLASHAQATPMSKSFLRLHIVSLALLSLAHQGCSAVAMLTGSFERPAVEVVASRVTALGTRRADVVIELEVENPNAFALTARDLSYRFALDGSMVAEGEWQLSATIPAKGKGRIELPLRVQLEKLLQSAATGLALGEIPYQLDATLTVGTFLLQRDIEITEASVLRLNLPLGLARLGHLGAALLGRKQKEP